MNNALASLEVSQICTCVVSKIHWQLAHYSIQEVLRSGRMVAVIAFVEVSFAVAAVGVFAGNTGEGSEVWTNS